ncbi:BRCA1-associated RING domain protein 1 isoform X1 [Lactuca sativa]|uniref:BRCA1-associated RING domain protein 1 isoform X1 n=2 Tax=Lactuca sativa TaxID=4236 RepID=UPI000CD8E99C|nr:BRCA1-associated RING domain protein 1 isoform X1 [Lactuca sativa]XP_023743763.1 BRCA1-associated RING domain protein 1 isoform X1 [Lactuca sativa]XP_042755255.1 BRCA1-associated RING domain protein 1 isoform X1 [Lactuca sativa]XP_052624508.1 BRCA1-associated RING domain protein 1 isoform X1 [Lactuca sativa]
MESSSSSSDDWSKDCSTIFLTTIVGAASLILAAEAESSLSRTGRAALNRDREAAQDSLNTVRYSPKRPVENDVNGMNLVSNTRSTSGAKSQTIGAKRQKKTNEGLKDTGLQINGHPQTNALASENVATTNSKLETEIEKSLSSGQQDALNSKKRPCAFCHSSSQTEGSGPFVSFAQGKEVVGSLANFSKVTHVHRNCIQWAPRIYFKDGIIQNLESEVTRANKLKCSSCGKKGAGLGCYMETCQRSYHVPCAYYIPECRWDDTYLMLCPKHRKMKFPSEMDADDVKQDTEKRTSTHLNPCTTPLDARQNLVFCGSDLSTEEKCSVVEFASNNEAVVFRYWKPNVTHVIAATDSNGACTRTYKVLMAILNGVWIVSVEWVNACMEARCLVNEEPYEVHLDTHGCTGGPKAGRLRVLNNGPKLFKNLEFYFVGDYIEAHKSDLKELVTTAGGTIIEARDQLLSSSNDADGDEDVKRVSLVVYNADLSDHSEFYDEDSIRFQRLAAAEDIAQQSRSQIIQHTWILESVAACRLLPFTSGVQ